MSECPDDMSCDGLPTVVKRLQTGHNSTLVLVPDDRPEHITYNDNSTRTVEASVLDYMQEQSFRVLQTGRDECEVTSQRQAWAVFRRRTPTEIDDDSTGDGGWSQ